VRCPDCGAVRDDWSAEVTAMLRELTRWVNERGLFAGYRLEFTGPCQGCRRPDGAMAGNGRITAG